MRHRSVYYLIRRVIIFSYRRTIGRLLFIFHDSALLQKIKKTNQMKWLVNNGYSHCEEIGRGKDGVVYSCEKNNYMVVVKLLSKFGKSFLPITQAICTKDINSKYLYKFKIINGCAMEYQRENLSYASTYPKDFLKTLVQLFSLEMDLLKHDMLVSDFGFSRINYMVNDAGTLRWIDYGGNAFLFLDNKYKNIVKTKRKNLVIASNRFIQVSLLLHIGVFGLGKKDWKLVARTIQWDLSDFNNIVENIKPYYNNTIYFNIFNKILSSNMLIESSWAELIEETLNSIDSIQNEKKGAVIERANISEVKCSDEHCSIRGYQNYDISKKNILPLEEGAKWAVTSVKWKLVDKILKEIKGGNTYLDTGCNLGLYVFTASINHNLSSTGVDYNKSYLQSCKKVNDELGLGCEFERKSFSSIENQYDIVSLLGVIHHLYNRTEDYGDLEEVIKKIHKITRLAAIVEFPTEKDSKAEKWTNLIGRNSNSGYSLELFEKICRKYFEKVLLVGFVTNDRPIYVLNKKLV